MRKLNLLIFLLIAWPIGMLAEVSRDSLPSNYGNWVNLTEGYTQDHSYDHQKMQVEMDGNTICYGQSLRSKAMELTVCGIVVLLTLAKPGKMLVWL